MYLNYCIIFITNKNTASALYLSQTKIQLSVSFFACTERKPETPKYILDKANAEEIP